MHVPGPAAIPLTILVIDDNPVDRDLFRRMLEQVRPGMPRFRSIEIEHGRGGLAQYRTVRPACVLLDLNLPDIDGLELLRAVLREPDPCPVVATTAYGSEQVAVEAMKAGAADYVVKGSISPDGLVRTIENALDRRRLERALEEQRTAIAERNRQLESALGREQAARAAAEQSENRYRTLAETVPQVIWTADHPGGEWTYVNQRWTRLTGAPTESARGRGWLQFVEAEDRMEVERAWETALAGGTPLELQCRIRPTGGGPRWQLMRALPLADGGAAVKWLGTLTDVEDQRRAEQLVHQRQKLESIGILAGGVAHDFNNLLVGIVGGVSYALDVLPQDHELRPILDGALRAGERAAHLTRQMLAYAGKGRFQIERVDAARLLRATWEMIQSSIPHGVEVRLLVRGDLPPVHTDAVQLQQIAMNLIINAAEAIPQGRRGLVAVYADVKRLETPRASWSGELAPGEYLVIEVRDNGRGIEPDVLPKIFDPFFTTKFTGRGLGLAAVQGIVRGNRGAIEVESALGEGSTFRVLLPAGLPAEEEKPTAAPAPAPRQARGRILVVDDEPVVGSTAVAVLRGAGFQTEAAPTGREALALLASPGERYSLVLLDCNMPDLDGAETLERLRRIDAEVPVVICSGYSEAEMRARFQGQAVSGFLQKPFHAAALTGAVTELMRPA